MAAEASDIEGRHVVVIDLKQNPAFDFTIEDSSGVDGISVDISISNSEARIVADGLKPTSTITTLVTNLQGTITRHGLTNGETSAAAEPVSDSTVEGRNGPSTTVYRLVQIPPVPVPDTTVEGRNGLSFPRVYRLVPASGEENAIIAIIQPRRNPSYD